MPTTASNNPVNVQDRPAPVKEVPVSGGVLQPAGERPIDMSSGPMFRGVRPKLERQYREATEACDATIGTPAYHSACDRQHAIYEQIQREAEVALGWTGKVRATGETLGRWQQPSGGYLAGWTLGD